LEASLTKQETVTSGKIPRHIAIIMDGNGRWARRQSLPRVAGHQEGINSVREVVEACGQLGVAYLTMYTFSKENWNRPKREVAALMRLLLRTIRAEVNELDKNNVRLGVIGNLNDLPLAARKGMQGAIARLKGNTGLYLNLALSYSSRREITDCVRKLCERVAHGEMRPDDISEDIISGHLYTADIPDPDLLIRTSGELRISNFLLWQLAYTEIYVTDVLWPDFREQELHKAIAAFQSRERRFGKVSEQLPTDDKTVAQSVH
jgi:undecaprenyl diphosphate synthase